MTGLVEQPIRKLRPDLDAMLKRIDEQRRNLRPDVGAILERIHVEREKLHRNIEEAKAAHARLTQTMVLLRGQVLDMRQIDAGLILPEIQEMVSRIARLSPRQRRVLEKVIAGESNKAIAYDLGLSQKTVETHRARVMRKLNASSLAELVRIASRAVPRAVVDAFAGGNGSRRSA